MRCQLSSYVMLTSKERGVYPIERLKIKNYHGTLPPPLPMHSEQGERQLTYRCIPVVVLSGQLDNEPSYFIEHSSGCVSPVRYVKKALS